MNGERKRDALKKTADQEELYGVIDEQFAELMLSVSGRASDPVLRRYARDVSRATRERNVCIDVPESDRSALAESGVVGTSEDPDFPMVLDLKGRLYLNRYWQYEQMIAGRILERIAPDSRLRRKQKISSRLDEYFPIEDREHNQGQREAAEFALSHRLAIISGGPGTGKTTTVAVILALLVEFAEKEKPIIALAAPTGKAAARLQESIIGQKQRLPIPEEVRENIPEDAGTIHRLLKWKQGTPYFRHDSRNPLLADVIVLDECSMIDAALMAKFMDAVRPDTKLILLGDKDQLSSVEAGAVFSDLCSAGLPCVKQLTHSYRFGAASSIGAVSRAVNAGDAEEALAIFQSGYADIARRAFADADEYERVLTRTLIDGYAAYLRSESVEEAFARLREFKILCALREGPYGVTGVNKKAEEVLENAGLIDRTSGMWYRAQPVMIAENDYGLSLFNGDVGILWPDREHEGTLMAFFEGGEKGLRRFHPSTLPPHETVFAMTVHKSQGSQFTRVLTILPAEESPVVTRELLYTALTRAERYVELWSAEGVLRQAVIRRTVRHSGLRDILEERRRV